MSQTAGLAACTSLAELEARLIEMGVVPCEGESFSELDHGMQCAEVLRAMAPDDLELQVAGLLHDVASGRCLDRDHGRVGAAVVRGLMGERISELVRLHVEAKRYLVTADPAYRARLSPVSIATLELQGGDMAPDEMAAFEASPYRDDALRLREADDLAKTPDKPTLGLDFWLVALHQTALSVD
jgi:predicted HD phosphohydrolase